MKEKPFVRSTTGSDIVIRHAGHRVRVGTEWQQIAERIVTHLLERMPGSIMVKRVMEAPEPVTDRPRKKISRKRESKSDESFSEDSQPHAPTAQGEEV